jgi:hypothetical protein
MLQFSTKYVGVFPRANPNGDITFSEITYALITTHKYLYNGRYNIFHNVKSKMYLR